MALRSSTAASDSGASASSTTRTRTAARTSSSRSTTARCSARAGTSSRPDLLQARIDRARYDALTDLALEANFNFLRIWGGGLYESDDFYELCDEKGILVWQEFIFACSRYPADTLAFLNEVVEEARYQVRRLASHASLVVWCGNNEIEWLYWDHEHLRPSYLPDHVLFHDVLPDVLRDEDGTRFYLPSSPISPDGAFPNADDRGDQHPWSIGFENIDFREYREMICRFPNEGGILGPSSLPTVLECLPEDERRLDSPSWFLHDNTISAVQPSNCDRMLELFCGLDPRAMSLEEYVYWGGLVEGEGLREYIENFRWRMWSSAAACFWMYNDCWPATRSWTIVDYALRRTPAFHPVRRAMEPVHAWS